jgi:hypothetical protein
LIKINTFSEKGITDNWATNVIVNKQTKVNYRPRGEISPNLVTLKLTYEQKMSPFLFSFQRQRILFLQSMSHMECGMTRLGEFSPFR